MEVKPIFIDTNAYVAFKRGQREALEILRRAPVLGVSSVVLGELLSGFALGSRNEANRKELAEFLASARAVVLAVDSGTADAYATIYAGLRRAGTPIPTNDMWIAASALQHRFDLFSYDAHFRLISGIRTGSTVQELE